MKAIAFICGCGHTGTSLLANMFAAHPDVFVPLRETQTFVDATRAPALLASLLEEAKASQKQHLVEKTPSHVHQLDLIRSMVPGARFILTVRDGRDVAASFIKRYGSARPGIEQGTGHELMEFFEYDSGPIAGERRTVCRAIE